MSQELLTDIIFTNQKDGGITPKKLNLAWRDATIQPAFVSDKPLVASYGGGDYLLLLKADGTYAKILASVVATGSAVSPGTWTALSYSAGWTQNTTAQFRVETNGAFQKLICQGIINYASGAAALAFTLPAGARPGVQRGCALGGYDSSGDVQLFQAVIATSGAVTIFPMVRQNFSWPSATNGSVYLDNFTFSL